ncbi:MAG: DUF1553 domain-containing protein [Verrucomicrobiia bacterium]
MPEFSEFYRRRSGLRIAVAGVVALICAGSLGAAEISLEQIEFFESRIRPVLAQDCYECHNSRGKAKGGLILDHREALLKGGDSGKAIVPGDAKASLLIQAIRHDDEDLAMPKAGAKLDEAIVRDFEKWVNLGAPDPRDAPPSDAELAKDTDWAAVLERRKAWWSFQPIKAPALPKSGTSPHPVDRFIRAGLPSAGLTPSTPADPNTLVRRLYFALIGLPPTAEQVAAFEKSHSANPSKAVEALVDELLESPHFGERWARHWMDWIRYAESHGSEGDPKIGNAHLYRDYLIRALNADVPYNQLLREHVAGDLLNRPRINPELEINESLIGTAHWRMVFHGFAPTDALDEKVRFTDDQINVFSKAFLGLTVSCARCHDHKFDAISQADYYALFGIFGSTRPGRAPIEISKIRNSNMALLAGQKHEVRNALADEWKQSLGRLEREILAELKPSKSAKSMSSILRPLALLSGKSGDPKSFAAEWAKLVEEWKQDRERRDAIETRKPERRWRLADDRVYQDWFRHGDGLAKRASKSGDFAIASDGKQALMGIYPAGVYSHLLSTRHGARLTSPDFRLDGEYELWLRITGGGSAMSRYVVQNYPRNGTVFPVTELKDDKAGEWRWQKYDLAYWKGDDIHIELTTANDAPLLVKNKDRSWFGIREAVLQKKGEPAPSVSDPVSALDLIFKAAKRAPSAPNDLIRVYSFVIEDAIEAWAGNNASEAQALFLDACLREGLLENEFDKLVIAKEAVAKYRRIEKAVPVVTRVPTLAEWKGADQPLFDRGNHKLPLNTVPRRFLEAIDATPYETELSGRRELAEDLLRPDNPFTRRVIVNRIWHHLFGRGIVDTPDNFGRLGSKPSHPELLDHLATRFSVVDQWSIKSLVRYLVTSETWRQSSVPSQKAAATDPDNRLLSHFSVRRLEAEAIRDSLLQVSGKLDRKLFGAPVNGSSPRRSIYVNVIRNRLDPFLTTFDAPVPFSSKGRRDVTTVPGQSLTMMNGKFAIDAARAWGKRMEDAGPLDDAFVTRYWLAAFARKPTQEEIKGSLDFMSSRLQAYSSMMGQRAGALLDRGNEQVRLSHLEFIARRNINAKRGKAVAAESAQILKPIAEWKFDGDAKDGIGGLDCALVGGARIRNGALVLDGATFARSAPLKRDLREKTLEAWVQLDTLSQRGAGVMTVQTRDGVTFDSIVFGEKEPEQWLAGSNNFRRTESFGGEREAEPVQEPVHIAIVYRGDGTIVGYRNGRRYGDGYKSSGLQAFKADEAEVVFGLRHGTSGGGNRMLKGRILEARLYDRPLTGEEIAAAANNDADFISEADLLAALPQERRNQWKQNKQEIAKANAVLAANRAAWPSAGKDQTWADLALAIFNMKEFIYVR